MQVFRRDGGWWSIPRHGGRGLSGDFAKSLGWDYYGGVVFVRFMKGMNDE